MSICFEIELIPYPCSVHVSIGQSEEDFDAYCDANGFELDKSIESNVALTYPLDGGCSIIRFHKYPESVDELAYIHHEAFHSVCLMCRFIGIPLVRESEECYAYAMQYIYLKIIAAINDKLPTLI